MMNRRIPDSDVQAFLQSLREHSPSQIALGKSPFAEVSAAELATQVDGWQRSVYKLPTWAFSTPIYYPNSVNLEQCSSEHTALVKQSLIRKNAKVADLTGGFGVDSCYMAQEAAWVTHCEWDAELSAIAAHNAQVLGVYNMHCLPVNGIDFLHQQPDHSLDYIYIDPSRRVKHGKVFRIEECEPDIGLLQPLFFAKSRRVITKLSPLLDISSALRVLEYVKMVLVISVDNDCKELLFVQEEGFTAEPEIRAVRLFKDRLQEFAFTSREEQDIVSVLDLPAQYLYEPDVSITKAGAFKTLGHRFQLAKIHQHTHLYTSDLRVSDFPGKVFHIREVLPFGVFKRHKTTTKANVASRNFPLTVEEIKRRCRIVDGGTLQLFFTRNRDNELVVILCERLE